MSDGLNDSGRAPGGDYLYEPKPATPQDDGTWGWAFDRYTAHSPCDVCFPAPPKMPYVSTMCPDGRVLWDEYVRRFTAKAPHRLPDQSPQQPATSGTTETP